MGSVIQIIPHNDHRGEAVVNWYTWKNYLIVVRLRKKVARNLCFKKVICASKSYFYIPSLSDNLGRSFDD